MKVNFNWPCSRRFGDIHVAAKDSPVRYRLGADYVDDIQAAIDAAEAEGSFTTPNVVLAPGNYPLEKGLRIGYGPKREPRSNYACKLVGSRSWLRWHGGEGEWMIDYAARTGQLETDCAPCNLALDGGDRAHGMILEQYHGGTVHHLKFYNCRKGLRANRSWGSHFRRLQAYRCSDTVLDLGDWTQGSLIGLSIHGCATANGLVRINGTTSLVNVVNFDNCECGASPAVLIDGGTGTEVHNLRTEACNSPVIVQAVGATALELSGMSLWQDVDKVKVGVLLTDCEACVVERVMGGNIVQAIVRETGRCRDNQIERIVPRGRLPEYVIDPPRKQMDMARN